MMVGVGWDEGGGEGKEDSSKGAPERAGEGTAEEGGREGAERAFHTFGKETGSGEKGLRTGRLRRLPAPAAASPRGGAARAAGTVPPRAEKARRARTPRKRKCGGRPSCHLQPLPSRPPLPEARAGLTDKPQRERHTEREMIISCVESSGKVSPFGLSPVSDFSPSPFRSPDLAPSK